MYHSRLEAVLPVFLSINPSGVAYPKSFDVYTVFITDFPKCCNPQGSGRGCLVANSLVQYYYPVCSLMFNKNPVF